MRQLTDAQVLSQMDRMFASKQFLSAEARRMLLRFLVLRRIEDGSAKFDARSIAIEFFKVEPSFEPSTNSLVRVAVNRLRLALQLYYSNKNPNDRVFIEIPLRSYRPKFTLMERVEQSKGRSENALPADGISRLDALHEVYMQYQASASSGAHSWAIQMARRTIDSHPERVEGYAILAELAMDGRAMGYGDLNDNMDTALGAIEVAAKLDPDNPQLCVSETFAAISGGNLPKAIDRAGQLSRDPDPFLKTLGLWLLMISSNNELTSDCRRRLSGLSEEFGWLHHVPFLYSYRDGDYESALGEAILHGMPNQMWGPLERSAALGQLGLQRAAESEMKRVHWLNPGFRDNPRDHLRCYIPFDDDIEHVLDGLHRAGL